MEKPEWTGLVEHRIPLRDGKPVRQPSYQVPELLLPVLREKLDMMLQLGVIEPSFACAWSSPIILETKGLGKAKFLTILNFCKGYWQLS